MFTKNIPNRYGLLIKSIFLLSENKYVKNQIKRILCFIKYLDYRSWYLDFYRI